MSYCNRNGTGMDKQTKQTKHLCETNLLKLSIDPTMLDTSPRMQGVSPTLLGPSPTTLGANPISIGTTPATLGATPIRLGTTMPPPSQALARGLHTLQTRRRLWEPGRGRQQENAINRHPPPSPNPGPWGGWGAWGQSQVQGPRWDHSRDWGH